MWGCSWPCSAAALLFVFLLACVPIALRSAAHQVSCACPSAHPQACTCPVSVTLRSSVCKRSTVALLLQLHDGCCLRQSKGSQLGVQVMRVSFSVSIIRFIGAPRSGPPRPLAAAASRKGAAPAPSSAGDSFMTRLCVMPMNLLCGANATVFSAGNCFVRADTLRLICFSRGCMRTDSSAADVQSIRTATNLSL